MIRRILPRRGPEPEPAPMVARAKHTIDAKPTRIPKILVVDDELDVLRSTQMLLERLGYRTVVLPDAQQLTGVIQAEKPDLVLQDLIMPGLDLTRVFDAVRLPNGGAVPIVLFSASDELPDRAAELDAAGYLHKPFAEQQLRQVLEHLLGPAPRSPVPRPQGGPLGTIKSTDREALQTYFHEYRNTLTALNNYSQYLLSSHDLPSPEREAAEEINRLLLDLEKRGDLLRTHLLGDA